MRPGANRQNVKELIRSLLVARGEIRSWDVQQEAGITRQAAHYHLRQMVGRHEVEQVGAGRGARYRLPRRRTTRYPLAGLEEHRLWNDVVDADDRLGQLGENATSILRYAFTEIVNNAIDHSMGKLVESSRWWVDDRVFFEVADDGLGAFRTVREKLGLPDDFAAIQQISKGKTTTDPEHHTGQGIFFTSKAVDRFTLEANALRWTVDNLVDDQAVGEAPPFNGTRVRWDLDTRTERNLRQIFDAYTDPETLEFSRSRARVRLFQSGDAFVSRSEAKRFVYGLERFNDVIVDFSGVREVGQGFVDEIFRVWAREHPEVRLTAVNMSPAVEAMVRRGISPTN